MQNSATYLYCALRREAESLTTLVGCVSQPSYWHPYTATRAPTLPELHPTYRSALFAGHRSTAAHLHQRPDPTKIPRYASGAVTSIHGAILPRHRPEAWTARQPETSPSVLLEPRGRIIIHELQHAVNNAAEGVAQSHAAQQECNTPLAASTVRQGSTVFRAHSPLSPSAPYWPEAVSARPRQRLP